MGIYEEPLILYFVLFFSGTISSISAAPPEAAGFSIAAELAKMLLYTLPSLTLIWYLVIRAKSIWIWIVKPGKKDIIACLITFPCLLITGFVIAFISSYIGGNTVQVSFQSPGNIIGWVILSISCLSSAYLEESFFRFYLLTRKEDLNLNAASALIVSVVLFSICHIYEGPWGFLNSVISAVILAFLFLRYRSLHGIAIAHGMYNIAVYVINSLLIQR